MHINSLPLIMTVRSASSPAIFQRTIDIILQGLDQVACIQGDILLTGKDDGEEPQQFSTCLNSASSDGLRLKVNKCKFIKRTVTHMDYTLSAEGISPTEEKVEAIKSAPKPENTRQVRAFLGPLNYHDHGKFIPNLSTSTSYWRRTRSSSGRQRATSSFVLLRSLSHPHGF